MSSNRIKNVQHILSELVDFVKLYQPLINSHFGSIFSSNLWTTLIPVAVQNELHSSNNINEFIIKYPHIFNSTCPQEFQQKYSQTIAFIRSAFNLSLRSNESYLLLLDELYDRLHSMGCNHQTDIELKNFMTSKKLHEVEVMSKVSASLSDLTKCSHIVDLGGGKGYLSSVLTLHYNFKVLGVDSSEVTTCGAVVRTERLAKFWNSVGAKKCNEAYLEYDESSCRRKFAADNKDFVKKHYKQVITYVTPETNLLHILSNNFSEDCSGINLVGLHTCGNLAPTCLKMFINNPEVRSLVNVGCCYHAIEEEFFRNPFWEGVELPLECLNVGFPMSAYLREKHFMLGRNSRMLAAHSIDRFLANYDTEFSVRSLFHRAILQVILEKWDMGNATQVGRLDSKCTDFHEYIRRASEKLNFDFQMNHDDITELYNKYKPSEPFLKALFLLRISLAPVVESLIIFDRLLFLLEEGVKEAHIVPLFNLSISPRGYGIVAWKTEDSQEV